VLLSKREGDAISNYLTPNSKNKNKTPSPPHPQKKQAFEVPPQNTRLHTISTNMLTKGALKPKGLGSVQKALLG
jgi:hypothetical protein